MTPFDGAALKAMLRAFYPIVSGEELLRARRERPEYFAGGEIIGRHFDALRLPDGRIFDVIRAVDGPIEGRAWQMLDVTNQTGGASGLFALEPGPLTPADDTVFPRPGGEPARDFEQLLAGALDELGAADAPLHDAERTVASSSSPADLDAALGLELADLGGGLTGARHRLDDLHAEELLETAGGAGGRIHQAHAEYPDPDEVGPEPMAVSDPGVEPDPDAFPGRDSEEPPMV